MEKGNKISDLQLQIEALKSQQELDYAEFKVAINNSAKKLNPFSFLSNAVEEISDNPDIKNELVDDSIGIFTGYLFKNIFVGKSSNPFKKILGSLTQFFVSNYVAQHTELIKNTGEKLIQVFLNYKKNRKED
jgi:hypothetical protein